MTYDVWKRLVEVKDGATTVAEYQYDGLHRRTVKTVDSDVKHFYYNTDWHLYYVDALAVRYWDSDEDGVGNGRLARRSFGSG